MIINGTQIDEDVVSRALGSVDASNGFTASELQAALEGLGVVKGETAMRAADRALQRGRRAGKLEWKNRRWHAQEAGQ